MTGVNPAIDMYKVVHGVLGERFLKFRIHNDEAKTIDKPLKIKLSLSYNTRYSRNREKITSHLLPFAIFRCITKSVVQGRVCFVLAAQVATYAANHITFSIPLLQPIIVNNCTEPVWLDQQRRYK